MCSTEKLTPLSARDPARPPPDETARDFDLGGAGSEAAARPMRARFPAGAGDEAEPSPESRARLPRAGEGDGER